MKKHKEVFIKGLRTLFELTWYTMKVFAAIGTFFLAAALVVAFYQFASVSIATGGSIAAAMAFTYWVGTWN